MLFYTMLVVGAETQDQKKSSLFGTYKSTNRCGYVGSKQQSVSGVVVVWNKSTNRWIVLNLLVSVLKRDFLQRAVPGGVTLQEFAVRHRVSSGGSSE